MEARVKKLERLNKILFAGLALALLPWIVGAAAKIPDLIQGKSMEAQQWNTGLASNRQALLGNAS